MSTFPRNDARSSGKRARLVAYLMLAGLALICLFQLQTPVASMSTAQWIVRNGCVDRDTPIGCKHPMYDPYLRCHICPGTKVFKPKVSAWSSISTEAPSVVEAEVSARKHLPAAEVSDQERAKVDYFVLNQTRLTELSQALASEFGATSENLGGSIKVEFRPKRYEDEQLEKQRQQIEDLKLQYREMMASNKTFGPRFNLKELSDLALRSLNYVDPDRKDDSTGQITPSIRTTVIPIGEVSDEKTAALADQLKHDQSALNDVFECRRRILRFIAHRVSPDGKRCWGPLLANICYGGCETGELAALSYPYKVSLHKVCTYGRRKHLRVILDNCDEGATKELRTYEYVEAESCACKHCSSSDTNCLGTVSTPSIPTDYLQASESPFTKMLS